MTKVSDKESENHNYEKILDDIFSRLFDRQLAIHQTFQRIGSQIDSEGKDVTMDHDKRFQKSLDSMAQISAIRECGWAMGLGPEHTEHIVTLFIDRYFGAAKK